MTIPLAPNAGRPIRSKDPKIRAIILRWRASPLSKLQVVRKGKK